MENAGIFYGHLEYLQPFGIFKAIWNILQPFGIFYGHLVCNAVAIWYIFPRFGILCQEKSGNPVGNCVTAKFVSHKTKFDGSFFYDFTIVKFYNVLEGTYFAFDEELLTMQLCYLHTIHFRLCTTTKYIHFICCM
jgi:hypothetical protein